MRGLLTMLLGLLLLRMLLPLPRRREAEADVAAAAGTSLLARVWLPEEESRQPWHCLLCKPSIIFVI
jgi:hypothetical protein